MTGRFIVAGAPKFSSFAGLIRYLFHLWFVQKIGRFAVIFVEREFFRTVHIAFGGLRDVPTDDFVGRGFARLDSLAGSTHTLFPLSRGSLL